MCIAAALHCDGLTFDCSDQSDEMNCAEVVPTGGSAGTGGGGSGVGGSGGAGGGAAPGGAGGTGGAAGTVNQGGALAGGGAAGLVGAAGATGGAAGATGSSGTSGSTANGGVPGTGGAPSLLRVQYYTGDTAPADAVIDFRLQIGNASNEAVPYSELTVRYYYSNEHAGPESYWNFYSQIGSANVLGTSYDNPTPVPGAERYLEVTFTAGAGSLAAHSASGEMQIRIAHTMQNAEFVYDETDDYSYNSDLTEFADWDHITLYRDGVLVYGIEPA
jgi:endoglucanase